MRLLRVYNGNKRFNNQKNCPIDFEDSFLYIFQIPFIMVGDLSDLVRDFLQESSGNPLIRVLIAGNRTIGSARSGDNITPYIAIALPWQFMQRYLQINGRTDVQPESAGKELWEALLSDLNLLDIEVPDFDMPDMALPLNVVLEEFTKLEDWKIPLAHYVETARKFNRHINAIKTNLLNYDRRYWSGGFLIELPNPADYSHVLEVLSYSIR